jgi:hypothetical protein
MVENWVSVTTNCYLTHLLKTKFQKHTVILPDVAEAKAASAAAAAQQWHHSDSSLEKRGFTEWRKYAGPLLGTFSVGFHGVPSFPSMVAQTATHGCSQKVGP